MFVFDKKLNPEQAINFKSSSKAPFGFMKGFGIGSVPAVLTGGEIVATDPSLPANEKEGTGKGDKAAATAGNAVALLTRVRWDLGATDPICLEGLTTASVRQKLVGLLYAGLTDITVTFH